MNKNKKIYISGMHSGQNPCSGVGIARCLRKAFPNMKLVGVDHWQGSTGLHHDAIDEVFLLPQWKHINVERHVKHVRELLDDGNLWISALDMEVHWFSKNMGAHPNLLAPGSKALELSAKPSVKALEGAGFRVPEYIPASLSNSDLHSFLRHNSWQCWLKSPFHDARRVSSWGAFERAREALSRDWETGRLFVQKHVVGNEETVAFTAYHGELLAAARMEKRQITPEGKTWAGRVSPVDPETYEHLKQGIRRMEWSGGGELEYVRDPDGQRWIIECNPRFPAWIFGGAIAGMNLPARLISCAWNLPFVESLAKFPFFARVVQEIPARESVGLPLPPDPGSLAWVSDGKKGKGGSAYVPFYATLKDDYATDDDEDETCEDDENDAPEQKMQNEQLPLLYAEEVHRVAHTFEGETPARITLDGWLEARFDELAERVRAARASQPEIRIGYSVKTSPTDAHLRLARERGFFAECISQAEVKRALNFGFRPEQVILNGPGKFWPLTQPPELGLHMIFADSIEEFDRMMSLPGMTKCIGFRLRLPKVHSRFGNALDDYAQFERILAGVRQMKGKLPLGFHFHMPSWAIGVQRWTEALQSLLIWCQSIERLTGVPVRRLDLGGGFFPADLERLNFEAIQSLVAEALPNVEALYFEPGRSMTQDTEVLVSRVLDVRKTDDDSPHEVVVDACVAELPLAQSFSHRIFFKSKSARAGCTLLRQGDTRVLGRICMEDDILSNGLELPKDIGIGDYVIFGDAGGYERSMSYVFGRG